MLATNTDAIHLRKPNKTLPLINKEARRINCVEFDLILFIYKSLQHFFFKSHLDFILNAFIQSPSSQIVNTSDSLQWIECC